MPAREFGLAQWFGVAASACGGGGDWCLGPVWRRPDLVFSWCFLDSWDPKLFFFLCGSGAPLAVIMPSGMFKLFDNSLGNLHNKSALLDITFRFTCGSSGLY